MSPARISLLSLVFAVSVQAAEIPVDPPAYAPAPENQERVALASNGEQYFALWNDRRSDALLKQGMRMSPNGTPLEPNGIRVKTRSGAQGHVVWAGNVWFVVSEGDWSVDLGDDNPISLMRFDRDGNALDAEPRVLPVLPDSGITVTAHGAYVVVGYTLVWEKRALVIDPNGQLVGDFALSGSTTPIRRDPPAIASNGVDLVALWVAGEPAPAHTQQRIDGVRFDLGGPLGAPRSVFGSFSQGPIQMASDGRDFVVIQDEGVYRMTADLEVEFLFGSYQERAHSVVWTGSSYVIVLGYPTGDARDVKFVRLDRDGKVLGQQTMRLEGKGTLISSRVAASAGDSLLLLWHDVTEVPSSTIQRFTDTYAATVSLPSLTAGPRKLLSVAAVKQSRPSTAVSATNALTIWHEDAGFYARRYRRDGGADSPPIWLSPGAGDSAVVFNGTDYIVASAEGGKIVARRMPANGPLRVENESRIPGGSFARYVALATNGATTLVAWFDNYEYNFHGGSVYAARLDAGGAFAESGQVLLALPDRARTVQKIAVSANDSGEFLVVWGGSNRSCTYCSPPGGPESDVLRAARMTSSMLVLDNPPIDVVAPVLAWPSEPYFDNVANTHYIDHPSVTWNGTDWLVVWNRGFIVEGADGESLFREEIRGRRIARDGTRLDGARRDPGILIARDAFAPTVAWTGSRYELAWYEGFVNHRFSAYLERFPVLRLRSGAFEEIGGPLTNVRSLGELKWADPISISVGEGWVSRAYARLADERQYGGISRAFMEMTSETVRRRGVRR